MPLVQPSSIHAASEVLQVAKTFLSNADNVNKLKKSRAIVFECLSEEFRKHPAISDALDTDGEDKTKRTTEEKDFDFSTLRFGEGSLANELRKAVSFICAWKEHRDAKRFNGNANDHKNLIALFILETLRRLSDAKVLETREGVLILEALSESLQRISLTESLVSSKNPDPLNNLKKALLNARQHILRAKEIAECEIYDRASVQYLEGMVRANHSLLHETPEFILCLLAEQKVPTSMVAYSDPADDSWQHLKGTFLQMLVYKVFDPNLGKDPRQVGEKYGSKEWEEFLKVFTHPLDETKTPKNLFQWTNNIVKVIFSPASLTSSSSAKISYLKTNVKEEKSAVQIQSGMANEVLSSSANQEVFSNLTEFLNLTAALTKLLNVQIMLRDYAKNYGDYGIYIKARDTLSNLLQASNAVLAALKQKMEKLLEQINKVREQAKNDVGLQRKENIRRAMNHLKNLKIHIAKCEEVIGYLKTQLQVWNTKSPTEIDIEKDAGRLAQELRGVKHTLDSVGIAVDLSPMGLSASKQPSNAPLLALQRPRGASADVHEEKREKYSDANKGKTWNGKISEAYIDPLTQQEFKTEPAFVQHLQQSRQEFIEENARLRQQVGVLQGAQKTAKPSQSIPLKNQQSKPKNEDQEFIGQNNKRSLPYLFYYKAKTVDRNEHVKVAFEHDRQSKPHFDAYANDVFAFARSGIDRHILGAYIEQENALLDCLSQSKKQSNLILLGQALQSLQNMDQLLAKRLPLTLTKGNQRDVDWREFVVESRMAIIQRMLDLYKHYISSFHTVLAHKDFDAMKSMLNDFWQWLEEQKFSGVRQAYWSIFGSKNSQLQNKFETTKIQVLDLKKSLEEQLVLQKSPSQNPSLLVVAQKLPQSDISGSVKNNASHTESEEIPVVNKNFIKPPEFKSEFLLEENVNALITYVKKIMEHENLPELEKIDKARHDHAEKLNIDESELIYSTIVKPSVRFAEKIHSLEALQPASARKLAIFIDTQVTGKLFFDLEVLSKQTNSANSIEARLKHVICIVRLFGSKEQNIELRSIKKRVQEKLMSKQEPMVVPKAKPVNPATGENYSHAVRL